MSEVPPGDQVEPAERLANFQDKAGALSVMLSSPGWAEARVIFEGRLRLIIAELLQPPTRERAATDDYLRGQIQALTLVLKTPLALLESYAKIVRDSQADMIAQRAAGQPDPWTTRAAEFGIRAAGYPVDPDFADNLQGRES